MKKINGIVLCLIIAITYILPVVPTFAVDISCGSSEYVLANTLSNNTKEVISCHTSYAEAKDKMHSLPASSNSVPTIYLNNKVIDTTHGILFLRTSADVTIYPNGTNQSINLQDSIGSPNDMAILGLDYGTKEAFVRISGLNGVIYLNSSYIIEYKIVPTSIAKYTSYYINEDNHLKHVYARNVDYSDYKSTILLSPSYPKILSNTKYYSYDGKYFYTDLFTMVDDYKNGGSIGRAYNKTPYYNYYQYLPHRTKTNYTAADIDNYLKERNYVGKPTSYPSNSNQTMLYGEGENLKSAESNYGVNAAMIFSLAVHESAWGRSSKAINNKNLFGHGVYSDTAVGYIAPSIKWGIDYHAHGYISNGYARVDDWRYTGSHFGNKYNGINWVYATDPYWGEKAGAQYYQLDRHYNLQDYNNYKIGIKKVSGGVIIRKEASTASAQIYKVTTDELPFVILGEVIGQEYNGSKVWYKIQTDNLLDGNRNYISGGVKINDDYNWNNATKYDFDNNYGYIHSSLIYVEEVEAPIIYASDITLPVNTSFDVMANVEANDRLDGDITNKITVVSNNVNTSVVGVYSVTYRVENSNKKETTRTIKVTIRSNTAPTITAADISHDISTSFNPLSGVSAFDHEDGNITSKIIVETNNVNINALGTYTVTYKVIDSDLNTTTKTINVRIKENTNPVITASNLDITQHSTFNPLSGVSAYDNEDGDITNKIIVEGSVNTSLVGRYDITYKVTDSDLNTTTKTITVIVNGDYVKSDGNFYFEDFTYDNQSNKFLVKGYLTIKNINNNDPFKTYDLVLVKSDNTEYIIPLDSWNDGVPFNVANEGNYSYSNSWFKGNISLTDVDEGDYTLYIRARAKGHEARVLFRNMFLKNMSKKVTDESGRGYLIRTNYYVNTIPLELQIRNDGLISTKEPGNSETMYNNYSSINFNNNMLNIKGTSFNIGGNYGKDKNVERWIILENLTTYEKTIYSGISAITNGDYAVTLRIPDGLDKTKAWFNSSIDVSILDPGSYAIYIRTKVDNIDDYGELNDVFLKPITGNMTINSKNYSLKVNQKNHFRIELVVE